MRIIHSRNAWGQFPKNAVIALGNFDGLHKGHQVLLQQARALADDYGCPLAVMTFEPHPRRFFQPDLPILRIIPFAEKARLLKAAGVDILLVAPFNKPFASITAESFVTDMLVKELQVRHVVTGYNFTFGYKRGGDSSFLAAKAEEYGFGYLQVDAVEGYSSTAVRDALKAGDIAGANHMLGRPYAIQGTVLHGDKRGRQLGFPTANIRPAPLYLPKFGVYAVRLYVNGKWHDGVANLGIRPTIKNDSQPMLEVHLFDMVVEFYSERVKVELLHFVRGERKFDGLDALKAQIADDVIQAKMLLQKEDR